MPNLKGVRFILQNWKLIVHLLWKTNTFGVNNRWSVNFYSIMGGWSVGNRVINTLKVKPIITNYKQAKWRATACGFLTRAECKMLGWKPAI